MVPVRARKGVRRVRCRPKVEHYVALDIRKLQDYGLLKPGTQGSVLLKSSDGRQIATASFLIAPSKLRVQLEGVRCSVPTELCIERTACPFVRSAALDRGFDVAAATRGVQFSTDSTTTTALVVAAAWDSSTAVRTRRR
jgi:hypothetical protein